MLTKITNKQIFPIKLKKQRKQFNFSSSAKSTAKWHHKNEITKKKEQTATRIG